MSRLQLHIRQLRAVPRAYCGPGTDSLSGVRQFSMSTQNYLSKRSGDQERGNFYKNTNNCFEKLRRNTRINYQEFIKIHPLFGASFNTIANFTRLALFSGLSSFDILAKGTRTQNRQGSQESGSNSGSSYNSDGRTGAALFGSAIVASSTPDEADENDEQIMMLTKKMIEIRSILQKIDQSETLQLPSIVVVGSQSSGKSSVLEAIVGHEFLPKGSNMVTRRPIELTLFNTPGLAAEYGEFPALGLGKITDFNQIQRTLTDLNLAVSDEECVSDEPIQLHIYSPNVPDLTLIDLPGYVQVASLDQPESIKKKIHTLCEKYIQAPNVILAISAADVDLANSSALKASRRVDPRGERTIGVITKIDLVEPSRGAEILLNRNYPLQMGYVGVITKTPPSHGLFRRNSNISSLVAENEKGYFSCHEEFDVCTVGTLALKKKLMHVLEKTMASSLQPTADAIHQELEESAYQFKVEYNDRRLTPETYLASSVDAFKVNFKEFTRMFGREEVKELLRCELDQKILDLIAQRYWNKPITSLELIDEASKLLERPITELSSAAKDDVYWQRKLDLASSTLTKLGIGRMSTNLVIDSLMSNMDKLIATTNFSSHPFAHTAIRDAASSILNNRFYSTADQVENCIKPYKYEIDVEDREWEISREHSYKLLKEELKQCDNALNSMKKTIGGKKLTKVMNFVENSRNGTVMNLSEGTEAYGFSQALITRGREALFLRERSDIIKLRMIAIKSRQCKDKENKYYCPEVFLNVVADKLTQTAVLFLNVELLSDFYHNFPRELDNRFGQNLSKDRIEAFAKEDPKIKKHIELQQRKELLQLALEKVESVIELQKSRAREESEQARITQSLWR